MVNDEDDAEDSSAEQEGPEEPAAEDEAVNDEASPPEVPLMPQVSLTFLLVSGKRRSMTFEPETTVGRTKELVWNAWPKVRPLTSERLSDPAALYRGAPLHQINPAFRDEGRTEEKGYQEELGHRRLGANAGTGLLRELHYMLGTLATPDRLFSPLLRASIRRDEIFVRSGGQSSRSAMGKTPL
ncbi:hypothetical protein EIP86_005129 [Pleurotus ostreatoroseus]|nr:hypothetical protein EIP86_005129 [Pleurotus ostreatoroseus]